MASSFKRYTSSSVGTGATTIYTVPSSTEAIMMGCNIANITASQISVDVQVANVYLVKGAPIPANSALSVLDGKINLEVSDTVIVTSNTASSTDVILSVFEKA